MTEHIHEDAPVDETYPKELAEEALVDACGEEVSCFEVKQDEDGKWLAVHLPGPCDHLHHSPDYPHNNVWWW